MAEEEVDAECNYFAVLCSFARSGLTEVIFTDFRYSAPGSPAFLDSDFPQDGEIAQAAKEKGAGDVYADAII